MNNNSVEKIIENVLTNEKYLKSDKRVYRLVLSNLQSGLISVYGNHNIGKKLFVINMIDNILLHNNADVLFITDKASKEEMAIRIATSSSGNNPFTLSMRIGVDKAMNRNFAFGESIKIIEKSSASIGLAREFAGMSKKKHKIVVYDTATSNELKLLKDLADELGIIIIATFLFPNDYDRPNYMLLRNIFEMSEVVLKISESYLDCKNECMEVAIEKNKIKEKDRLKLIVNQYRQRVCEPYERNAYYSDDEDLPF